MPCWSPIIPSDASDRKHFIFNREAADRYVIKAGSAVSNVLQGVTGGALIGEAASHFVKQPYKTAVRALLGHTQAGAGMLDMTQCTLKFAADPNVQNALGVIAAGFFTAEGAFRMIEAQNPHLPRTSAFGFGAALTKCAGGGPLSAIPYLLDAMCNGAEFSHGLPPGARKGVLGVAHEWTHRWQTRDLAALQRNVGMVMIGIAAVKTVLLAAGREPEHAGASPFEKQVSQACDRVDADALVQRLDEWEQALRTAQGQSEAAAQAKLTEFFETIIEETSTPAHRFAHVLENSPLEGVSLIRRFPGPARDAVRELRREAPDTYAALRTRYRVDEAFGARVGNQPA